jgi:hypothetical protein
MISFKKEDSVVYIIIETGMSTTIRTKFDCNNELYAELLYNQLKKHLADSIEAFAKDNYNKGWKDKTSKKVAKASWFPSWLSFRFS